MKKPNKELKKTLIMLGAVAGGCVAAMLIVRGVFGGKEVNEKSEKKEAVRGTISVDPEAMAHKNPEAEPVVYLAYAGFPDEIIITEKDPVIMLSNPSGNHKDYPFTYQIQDEDDTVFYETGLIPAGEEVEWNVGKCLAPGTYHVTIVEQPYQVTEDEQIPVTSTRQEVTIKVKTGNAGGTGE